MTPARERLTVVLGVLVAGAGTVLASTQTFATAVVTGAKDPIVVAGSAAAPSLAPLGIVALALGLALTIAGRVARVALGVLLLLLGAGIVAAALPNALSDTAGTAGAIVNATGVSQVDAFVTARSGTAWPELAVVTGVLAVLLGLVVVIRGHRWSTGGRRFRADLPTVRSTDPISEWDALSKGSDPTTSDDEPAGRER